jgi:hypothetical protein
MLSSLPFAHTATTREADLPVKLHAESTPALPENRKGQSGKVLLCPQQDYPATSVAHFCIAVLSRGMAQTMFRGVDRVQSRFIMTVAVNNLARLPRFLTARRGEKALGAYADRPLYRTTQPS